MKKCTESSVSCPNDKSMCCIDCDSPCDLRCKETETCTDYVETKTRYRVHGRTTVEVTIIVEAESEAEALEVAYDERNCLTQYVGNGGTDKLIGVDGEDETVEANGEIEYTSAEELEPEED